MSDLSTRERLLKAAYAVFAEKGFRDTTVAEICRRADANIAAVNYHFGDKESLYNACWRHGFALAMEAIPLDEGVDASSSPHDRLRAFIRAFMRRVFDETEIGYFPRMMVKEMAEPTAALDAILEEVVEPQRKVLHAIIADLLKTDPYDMRVIACGFSVISQCVFFAFNRALRERRLYAHGTPDEIAEHLADHVSRFCLAGIVDLKENPA
ncbi:MAG: CerR family C-terminal domain-containing protein [Verrucomicrobia bacterium]|nr:CerR family C-terminal domain-containing protein [Verrucomicrobiota bacterium]MBT7069057.1 CerR family C-terminal domain-containing protein [Verrucomicrobiota bacterium]MBT7699539.1 CerR family C-terminal domain-containing protein [Verrucomicrobiota bacterium]